MDATQIFLLLLVLIIGILLGVGLVYALFTINKEANHKAMDERGIGRRLK